MSTKEWVYRPEEGAGLYQEMSFDEHNNNPATIEIENPMGFKIEREKLPNGKAFFKLAVEIPTDRFDELAIAWIKHRGIQTQLNKYTLEGLLAAGDFKWPISEEELLNGIEDAELAQIVKDREGQEEVPANLEYDNIFDLATEDRENTKRLETNSDVAMKSRDIKELKGMFKLQTNAPTENFKGAAVAILKHIKAEQSITDEESLASAIEDALLNFMVKHQ
jgi:hypothetical protein